jgi:hypothetical protein
MAAPIAPTNIRATGVNNESAMYLTCDHAAPGTVVEYVWYLYFAEIARTTTPHAVVQNPNPNETVTYRVKASNTDGLSPFAQRQYITGYAQVGTIDGFQYIYRPTNYAAKLAARSAFLKNYLAPSGGVWLAGVGIEDNSKAYYPESGVIGMAGMWLLTGDADWYNMAIAQGEYVMNTPEQHFSNGLIRHPAWQTWGSPGLAQPNARAVFSFFIGGTMMNYQPLIDYARDIAVLMYTKIPQGTMTIGSVTEPVLHSTWTSIDGSGNCIGSSSSPNAICDYTAENGLAMIIGGTLSGNTAMVDFGVGMMDLAALVQQPDGGVRFWLYSGSTLPDNNQTLCDSNYGAYITMLLGEADKIMGTTRYSSVLVKFANYSRNYLSMEPYTFNKQSTLPAYRYAEMCLDQPFRTPAYAVAGFNYETMTRSIYSHLIVADGSEIDSTGAPVIPIWWFSHPEYVCHTMFIADVPIESFRTPTMVFDAPTEIYEDIPPTSTIVFSNIQLGAGEIIDIGGGGGDGGGGGVYPSLRLNYCYAGPLRYRVGRKTYQIGFGGNGSVRMMTSSGVKVLA